MGWSVSRHSEPERKRDLLGRRTARLLGAVRRGEGPIRIAVAAENVRLATLALIKARRALIREYPERDPDGRQSRNLRDQEERWSSLPVDAIVAEVGEVDA